VRKAAFAKAVKDVLFVDASNAFSPGKNQNALSETHLDRIIAVVKARQAVDKHACLAAVTEIAENDFSLTSRAMWIPSRKRRRSTLSRSSGRSSGWKLSWPGCG